MARENGTNGAVRTAPARHRCNSPSPCRRSGRQISFRSRTTLLRGALPMAPITFVVNGKSRTVTDAPDTPLLWVLRDSLGLTGTKFGCGIAQCGACTVHLDGVATRSCVTPVAAVAGKRVTTIEGLSANRSHRVQKAWIAEDVPQCGYCQSGQLMAAAALLATNPHPSDADIDAAMTNICRCALTSGSAPPSTARPRRRDMSTPTQVTRRAFLETAGAASAGLVISFYLPSGPRFRSTTAGPFAPNAWLRIGADESVLVIVDRSEMGQGVTTALPMLLAEELEADWSKIRIEFAPADKAYTNPMFGMQGTGGSTSVRAAYTPLRKAGAAAREMLLSAAAETWGVDKAACRAEKGAVIHTPSNRRLTYGKLVAKAATVPLPHDVPLKDPKDWKILGTRVKRLDTPPKVDGSAQFGIDVKTPGLLVAVVARSPVFGGKVKSFDATNAKAVPGVKHVVQISTGVAVVADGYWSAKKGRDALTVTWDEGPTGSVSSTTISQLFGQKAEQAGAVARHDGDAQGALPGAAAKLDAAYELPFLAHATMEPMNCTAHVRADGVDIWAPTQFQTGAQGVGAGIGGVPPEKVKVHTTYLGGGF